MVRPELVSSGSTSSLVRSPAQHVRAEAITHYDSLGNKQGVRLKFDAGRRDRSLSKDLVKSVHKLKASKVCST